jgi:transposase-like protein
MKKSPGSTLKDCAGVRGGDSVCPRCQSAKKQYSQNRKDADGYYICGFCGKVYTVRTGTVFEHSRVHLNKWLFAIHLIFTARKGISSLRLSQKIGVTQKTSWFMLSRIRQACKDEDSYKFLKSLAEVDEGNLGWLESKLV